MLDYKILLDSFILTSIGQMGVSKAALYLPEKTGGNEFFLIRAKGSPPFPEKGIKINPDSTFGRYLAEFAFTYSVYYAGLASPMIALAFLYLTASIFLYGGNLNSCILKMRAEKAAAKAQASAPPR